jgi:hypothetical protein
MRQDQIARNKRFMYIGPPIGDAMREAIITAAREIIRKVRRVWRWESGFGTKTRASEFR